MSFSIMDLKKAIKLLEQNQRPIWRCIKCGETYYLYGADDYPMCTSCQGELIYVR